MKPIQLVDACVRRYGQEAHRFELFANSVRDFFEKHPRLYPGVVHSVRTRLKAPESLRAKISRKNALGRGITEENLFQLVTDLAGVRVLHLHSGQFPQIHAEVRRQVEAGDWVLAESPKVFSWDPESNQYFTEQGFEVELRPTFYTSVHYLLRPNKASDICCELQVRTLFEEVWGEVDHLLNYPESTESVACREQLRALSKLVGSGSRLVDSIVRSTAEFEDLKKRAVRSIPAANTTAIGRAKAPPKKTK